jgi:hypothetical protein
MGGAGDARRRRHSRARLVAASLATGSLLGAASLASACAPQNDDPAGAAVVSSLTATTAPPPGPSVPIQRGTLPGSTAAIEPTRLRIDAIGLTATVRPVGVDKRTGDFAVPPSVDEVGWYKFGPGLDAAAGSVVIAGHVDGATQGKGAFFRLGTLRRGDTIEVTGADGVRRRFTVVAREQWDKTKIPLAKYFDRSGQPRLTLITCGGRFDAEARSYSDNIVITAVPTTARDTG